MINRKRSKFFDRKTEGAFFEHRSSTIKQSYGTPKKGCKAERNERKTGKREIPVIYADVVLASVILLVVVE